MYNSLHVVIEKLHSEKIAYVDWTPYNILMSTNGTAVLIDFGLVVLGNTLYYNNPVIASFEHASPIVYQRLWMYELRRLFYPWSNTKISKFMWMNSTKAWEELKRADYYGLATIFADIYVNLFQILVHGKTGPDKKLTKMFCFWVEWSKNEFFNHRKLPQPYTKQHQQMVNSLIVLQSRRVLALTKLVTRTNSTFPVHDAERDFVNTLIENIKHQEQDDKTVQFLLSGQDEQKLHSPLGNQSYHSCRTEFSG